MIDTFWLAFHAPSLVTNNFPSVTTRSLQGLSLLYFLTNVGALKPPWRRIPGTMRWSLRGAAAWMAGIDRLHAPHSRSWAELVSTLALCATTAEPGGWQTKETDGDFLWIKQSSKTQNHMKSLIWHSSQWRKPYLHSTLSMYVLCSLRIILHQQR